MTAAEVRRIAAPLHVRLATLDLAELEQLVVDARRMCVPKKVAAEHLDT